MTGNRFLIGIFFLAIAFFTKAADEKSIENNPEELVIHRLGNIPAKDVNCIYNDKKGFMWIGTLDGLLRYDGYTFKTYRIDPERNSITSNMIIAIDEDSKGNLWIGTYGKGICKLNPQTDEFTSFENKGNEEDKLPNDITTLIIDDKDVLWVGNWFGLLRATLDSSLNTISKLDVFNFHSISGESGNNIKTIFQDKEKNIWAGTNAFTVRILNPHQPAGEVDFERFNCHTEAINDFENGVVVGGFSINTITKNSTTGRYELKNINAQSALKVLYLNNKIWCAQRNGISVYEKDENGMWKMSKQLKKDFSAESLSSNITTALTTDNIGQIWYGTRGGGVDVISTEKRRFQHYRHTPDNRSLASDLVMSLFEDSRENLWVGTEDKGVSVLKKGQNYATGFTNIVVNNFGNENRVYAIEELPTPESPKHKSLVWMGTSHNKFLAAFNPETLEEISLPPQVSGIGHVFALENQNDSILWVGTYSSGLWRLRLDKKGNIKSMRNFTPKTNPNFLSYIIRNIYSDSNGNLWISTDKGINRIPKSEMFNENPVFEAFLPGPPPKQLSHSYILHITEDNHGNLWFGTMGGGLIKYEEAVNGSYSFSTVTVKEGLPNNTIKSIVPDNLGFLWLASNQGLARYNPVDGNIINYDKEDGLQDNVFSEICGLKRKNGTLVFGGINGINVFNSENIKTDETKPKLYFTDFLILNQEVRSGQTIDGKLILEKTIENTKSITLSYMHNSFSIGFVGVQYKSPQKNNYRYILEGFDKEWYKASTDHRVAKYTNVPDGEYTFKVMGSNSDNIWTEEPIELKIRIKPPGYRSPLALAIYLAVFVIIVIIVARALQEISLRRRDVLLANIEKERVEEISRLKLQFFTNISHEFRTPLSLITTPLDQLIKDGQNQFSKNQIYNLNLIKHNVGIMMRLINQLLDFRKLDQNKLKLSPSRQSLNQFLENIFQAFEVLANQKNIAYNFYPYPGGDDIWIDVDKMEKVIYNLLSNAFKYTGENGRIVLKADADTDSNHFIISVSDTGIGIDKDEEIHIFERYYQADNRKKRNISGTGIGLALAKGFVDLHKGEIGFYPNTDEGTVFFVKLKMGNAHFTQDMLIEPQELNTLAVPKYVSPKTEETDDENGKPPIRELPKMLIVEDNFELRKQVKNIFRADFVVVEAEDGAIGLEQARNNQPDIIITDVMMPNMDGMEMCNKIKEDEETSHIPVLILTAKNTDETIVEGYEFGADGYVAKPFNTEVLVARVKSLINNREKMRARFQKEIEINPKIISNTPADSKFLDKILSLIEENLSESDYSVEQLADDYGVSRIYLNRKIKALTGETTIEFVRNIKLKHAAELLKQNKLNISEVAWEVGYNDLRTFRKRFKEKFEMSPSDFAKQYK